MQHTKLKLEPSTKKYLFFIPVLFWAGIIVYMSLLPSNEIPKSIQLLSDKFIHASIYFGLTILLSIAFTYCNCTSSINQNYFLSVTIAFILGVCLEVLQDKMNIGRTGDWKDVAANSFGIVIVYPLLKSGRFKDLMNMLFSK